MDITVCETGICTSIYPWKKWIYIFENISYFFKWFLQEFALMWVNIFNVEGLTSAPLEFFHFQIKF